MKHSEAIMKMKVGPLAAGVVAALLPLKSCVTFSALSFLLPQVITLWCESQLEPQILISNRSATPESQKTTTTSVSVLLCVCVLHLSVH